MSNTSQGISLRHHLGSHADTPLPKIDLTYSHYFYEEECLEAIQQRRQELRQMKLLENSKNLKSNNKKCQTLTKS
jgi:hypothetical protein